MIPARRRAPRKPKEKPVTATAAAGARGEVSIQLDGHDYVLRPSFEAVDEMETSTGLSLYELTIAASSNTLSLAQVGEIIGACIRAKAKVDGNRDLAAARSARFASLVYEAGEGVYGVVSNELGKLLRGALTGGYTASGEAKA